MIGAILCGLLFATGHHLFYASLHGTPAPTIDDQYNIFGSSFTEQQTNTAIGNAFAFLVRACLVFAIALAYLQVLLWTAARGKDDVTLNLMDVLVSAPVNILSLGSLFVWTKGPFLFLIAIVAWLVPIASMITPATLSVGIQTPPPALTHVPNIAFENLSLVAELGEVPNARSLTGGLKSCATDDTDCLPGETTVAPQAYYAYNGPSNAVRKTASASAAQSRILSVTAPAPNSSWTLQFPGPALKCSPLELGRQRAFQQNIVNYTFVNYGNCSYKGPGFMVWRAKYNIGKYVVEDAVPYANLTFEGFTWNSEPLDLNNYFWPNDNKALFYVAVTPSLMEITMEADSIFGRPSTCGIPSEPSEDDVQKFFSESKLDSTMLQCSVHSSTYTANFQFVDGAQEVHFEQSNVLEQTLDTIWSITGLPKDAPELYSDPSIPNRCNHLGGYERGAACVFDSTVLRSMPYTAILHAYLELITGSLEWQEDAESGRRLSMNSCIASTALVQSPELEWIEDFSILDETWSPLQQVRPPWNDSIYYGLTNRKSSQRGPPLQQALEQLFHNITISLMSEPVLNYDKTSAFRPNETEVTFATRNIIYVYTRQKLWLAYGISIGVTLLTVLFGLIAIFANKACFSHEFSTYLRLSKVAELSIDIKQEDLDGRDPLPTFAGVAVIRFGRQADMADYKALPRPSDYEGKAGTVDVTTHDLDEIGERRSA